MWEYLAVMLKHCRRDTMKQLLRILCTLAMLCGSAVCTYAQDAEPADAADPLDTEPATPAAAGNAPVIEAPPGTTSNIPAVMAIIETKPSTPLERFRAAEIVTDLGDRPVAKRFLAELLAATPTDEALADLWEQLGTARFVRLKQLTELNPEATDLANKVQAAAEKRATDPARLEKLITQLQSPEQEDQRAAIELLRTGRGAAVNALLKILADPAKQADHAGARRAIVGGVSAGSGIGVSWLAYRDACRRSCRRSSSGSGAPPGGGAVAADGRRSTSRRVRRSIRRLSPAASWAAWRT